ncbi:hypothetical protein [Paenibacillus sp. SI8]|uniref:hypothetical protein n=1 Tax=unclassified Paenibacillus TaxID=185978 RepID=UPI003467962A
MDRPVCKNEVCPWEAVAAMALENKSRALTKPVQIKTTPNFIRKRQQAGLLPERNDLPAYRQQA